MTALEKVIRARVQLMERAPFFGALSLRLKLVEESAADCPTMAVDGVSLFFSAAFVDSVSEPELLGVMVHEILHCAYRHMTRRGNRDPEQWNYAADYAINPAVIAAGFVLPKGCLLDARFDGLSAETIYTMLERDKRDGKPKPASGSPLAGEVRDAPEPGEGSEPGEGEGSGSDIDGEWSDAVQQAIGVANRQAKAGRGHAGLETFKAGAKAAAVDWKPELARFTDMSAMRDFDWTRPNKRFAWQGLTLPSMVAIRPSCVIFAIDTSGSMDTEALIQITSEAQAALDAGAMDTLVLILANDGVQRVSEYQPGDTIDGTARASGGTDFGPTFELVAERYPDASALVYLTDGYPSAWGTEPACPVLWCLTLPQTAADRLNVPFGTKLAIY